MRLWSLWTDFYECQAFKSGFVKDFRLKTALQSGNIHASGLHLRISHFTFVSLFKRKGCTYRILSIKMDHNSYKTTYANKATAEKSWVIVDANAQVLGRVASQIAKIIRGKHKPSYSPHVDCGDHVIVINAEKVRMTGKKWSDRIIYTHSGYPGGQREHTPALIRSKYPERLIEHAVRGMLPKNTLGRELFRSLHVYTGSEHPHVAQQPKEIKF